MKRSEVIEWARLSIDKESWPTRNEHPFDMESGEYAGDLPALPDGFYWDRMPAYDDLQIHMKDSNPSMADYFWPIGLNCVHE